MGFGEDIYFLIFPTLPHSPHLPKFPSWEGEGRGVSPHLPTVPLLLYAPPPIINYFSLLPDELLPVASFLEMSNL
ncbi:hypothetical protein D5R40_14700 [Okeania hirsuta]|uniref:Uncharacterized protein n=1 Tax=Okeania hirsuta TaxID=1458930 RepID=A0A3N6PKP6_9CYAN|nr:hypothetical protein D4Z78_06805 [Okeania hirsuta]RQH42284.1 hypothetical protein D5R40_14700 [Okeania hirsuta]